MIEPDDAAAPSRRRLSRRAVIGAGAGALVLAAGIPTVWSLLNPPSGKLVSPLLASRPFVVAHHGGSADWPEMSMYAYGNSVSHRADALEVSLARTRDGIWFGLHDATLDRTSGTHDFVAAEHTWAQVRQYRITAKETRDPAQPTRPYATFDDLVRAYGATHTLFVDPKSASPAYYGELLALMAKGAANPRQTFIAKGYCMQTEWAVAARARGYHTWGFYYASEIESGATPLADTQPHWSVLGLNYLGSSETWRQVRALGKPVIAHVIPTHAGAATALAKGAAGLMVSGIAEVLG